MSDVLTPAHQALDELRSLVDTTTDVAEREGLRAFIDCVTPHMVENATMTFLGKIAQLVPTAGLTSNASSSAEALEALKEHFEVVVE